MSDSKVIKLSGTFHDPMDDIYGGNIDGGDRDREFQERGDYIGPEEAARLLDAEPANNQQITITVSYIDNEFYCNASCSDGSFVCTVGQPTVEMSIASAMPYIRKYAEWVATAPEREIDDPVCVCGVSRSEHSLCGCPEGFQTSGSWESEKSFIATLDDDQFDRIYHPYD